MDNLTFIYEGSSKSNASYCILLVPTLTEHSLVLVWSPTSECKHSVAVSGAFQQ